MRVLIFHMHCIEPTFPCSRPESAQSPKAQSSDDEDNDEDDANKKKPAKSEEGDIGWEIGGEEEGDG